MRIPCPEPLDDGAVYQSLRSFAGYVPWQEEAQRKEERSLLRGVASSEDQLMFWDKWGGVLLGHGTSFIPF